MLLSTVRFPGSRFGGITFAGISGDAADPCAPWGCAQQARFAAAAAFIASQQAHVGIVVKDRMTGAVWGQATRLPHVGRFHP